MQVINVLHRTVATGSTRFSKRSIKGIEAPRRAVLALNGALAGEVTWCSALGLISLNPKPYRALACAGSGVTGLQGLGCRVWERRAM